MTNNCFNSADIDSGSIIGGITGYNEGTIDTCCNIGKIIANGNSFFGGASTTYKASYAGGIVGYNSNIIRKSLNKGNIEALYRVVGGITGRNYGTVEYCSNAGSVKGEAVIGGIVGNNRGYILNVYNIAEEIENRLSTDGCVGGIAGNQNTTDNAYIKYAYNKAKVIGLIYGGGCIGGMNVGNASNFYNMGTIQVTNTTYKGEVYGYTYSTSAVTKSGSTTESVMIGWSQTTINNNIGSGFVKKTNSLPILNIKIPIYNNYTF